MISPFRHICMGALQLLSTYCIHKHGRQCNYNQRLIPAPNHCNYDSTHSRLKHYMKVCCQLHTLTKHFLVPRGSEASCMVKGKIPKPPLEIHLPSLKLLCHCINFHIASFNSIFWNSVTKGEYMFGHSSFVIWQNLLRQFCKYLVTIFKHSVSK